MNRIKKLAAALTVSVSLLTCAVSGAACGVTAAAAENSVSIAAQHEKPLAVAEGTDTAVSSSTITSVTTTTTYATTVRAATASSGGSFGSGLIGIIFGCAVSAAVVYSRKKEES